MVLVAGGYLKDIIRIACSALVGLVPGLSQGPATKPNTNPNEHRIRDFKLSVGRASRNTYRRKQNPADK